MHGRKFSWFVAALCVLCMVLSYKKPANDIRTQQQGRNALRNKFLKIALKNETGLFLYFAL